MSKYLITSAVLLFYLSLFENPVLSGTVRAENRSSCFAFENLPLEDQKLAQLILTQALDREALYTLKGNLKPISSGFFSVQHSLVPTDQEQRYLSRVKTVLSRLHCQDSLYATLVYFQSTAGGEKTAEAYFYNKQLVIQKMVDNPSFFSDKLGFTAYSVNVFGLLNAIEWALGADRYRGYGLLFGYPEHAVDFFIQAYLSEEQTGEFVKRKFVNIPVYSGSSGFFTYAVPENYRLQQVDLEIQTSAKTILQEYQKKRPRYLNVNNELNAVQLLRDWH